MLENTFDRKCISANPSSNPNPEAQKCFSTDEMTSFFEVVYKYPIKPLNHLPVRNIALDE